MCDRAFNRCFFVSDFVPDWYKTQEICYSLVSENNFLIVYCLGKYKTYRMCDEAVDDCLVTFKFIPDWLITSKMLEKFDNALHTNDDILYNEDFDKVTFIANQGYILSVDLDKVNLEMEIFFIKIILILLFMSYF